MLGKWRDHDLDKLARYVFSTITVDRMPADTYIKASELDTSLVLSVLDISRPEGLDDGEDYPEKYYEYARGLLDDLQGYIHERFAPLHYSAYHSPECDTKYRGCAPDCPKDLREKAAAKEEEEAI